MDVRTEGPRTLGGRVARLLAAGLLAAPLTVSNVPEGSAKYAAMVMDADTGKILHAVNADTRNYPASLTKMMTLYLVFEALEEFRLHLDQDLTVSARAARQPSSKLGLGRGRTITVQQGILALVTKSANDVATVFAETLAGDERKFALVMTAKARRLGMDRTTFRNASGLPHRGQLSTARDMAVLGRALRRDFPQYYHYFSRLTFTFGGTTYVNHNKLLTKFKGTDGIKTGYIRASGFNLVASAERGGRRLIGVIFGGRSPAARNRLMIKLLDKGFGRIGAAGTAAARAPDIRPAAARAKAHAKIAPRRTGNADAGGSRGRDAAPHAGSAGGARWGIQVGVYKTYGPALEIARKAARKARGLLEGGRIEVVPLYKRNRKLLYRGRILGLDRDQAYRACRALRRIDINCMELRMKADVKVASAR